MKTDTLIRTEGMNLLTKNLGLIEAERFIMLLQKEAFDYTQWQENLLEDMSINAIYNNAEKLRNEIELRRQEVKSGEKTSSEVFWNSIDGL